jgi:hypothetical protein
MAHDSRVAILRLMPRSPADRIRDAFAWLTEPPHAYRIVAESEGLGGAVTYRSESLWVAVEWDRGEPWLEFSPTRSAVGRFDWELVDHLLRGAAHFGGGGGTASEAPAGALAAWLRPRLGEIEARFRPPALAETNARLLALQSERTRARAAWWDRPREPGGGPTRKDRAT